MKYLLLLLSCLSLYAEPAIKEDVKTETAIVTDKETQAETSETTKNEPQATAATAATAAIAAPQEAPLLPEMTLMEGTVTSNRLNVRARPAIRYEVVAVLQQGEKIQVEEKRDKWMFIVPPKKTNAWIPGRSIDSKGKVIADNVKIHAGPGVEYTKFSTAPRGAQVTVVQRRDSGWVKIQGENWMRAWVSSDFVKLKETQARIEVVDASNTAEDPIDYAKGKEIQDNVQESINQSHDYEKRIAELEAAEAKLAADRKKQQDELEALATKLKKLKDENSEKSDNLTDLEKALARQHETIRRKDEKINELHSSALDVKKQQLLNTKPMTSLPDIESQPTPSESTTPKTQSPVVSTAVDPEDLKDMEIQPGQEILRGLIMPVHEKDHHIVDFALAVKIDKEYYPLCYVVGKIENLHTLYNREVILLGEKKRQDGWSRPIFHMAKHKLIRNK